MLESRFSAVASVQHRHNVIDGRIELGALAERRERELTRGGAQRGLELRPSALLVLELIDELAVFTLSLLFGRYLGHRRDP